MTISDALPIQFWPAGESTYNETDICGVEVPCYCHTVKCDDEFIIQFQEDTGLQFQMVILDSDGAVIREQDFVEISTGIYQYSSLYQNEVNCDQYVSFQIANAILENPGFDENPSPILDPWANSGAGVSWSNVSDAAYVDLSGGATSKVLRQQIFLNEGTYTISFDYVITGGTNVQMYRVITGPGSSTILVATSTPGSYSYSGTYTVGAGLAGLYYIGVQGVASGSPTVSLDNFALSRLVFQQSDCINVRTQPECTTLINYTNSDNFSNLSYEHSPQPDFYLRVPAQFWKQDNPMEQEDSELSNGVIKTRRQTISEKQLLEVGYMPNYMHKKLQLVLMHDTITIDGDQWKRRDPYESENVRRYALKRANVWLTKYNSIEDNIL